MGRPAASDKGLARPTTARLAALAALVPLLVIAGCASSPSEPGADNHAPRINGVVEAQSRVRIPSAPSTMLLRASTTDADGDPLDFVWTGPGSFINQDDNAKTVQWVVPANTEGVVEITCRVTDTHDASDEMAVGFNIGRKLSSSNYGEPQAGELLWSPAAAASYVLTGTVTIPAEVLLRIAAGTTIYVDGASKLIARGGLIVEGGSAAVNIQANTSDPSAISRNWWDGIAIESSEGALAIEGLNVFNAWIGLDLGLGVPTGATIVDSGFTGCDKALFAGNTAIAATLFRAVDCNYGMDLDGCALTAENCQFSQIDTQGLRLRNECTGTVLSSSFSDGASAYVRLEGDSILEFHENSFFGGVEDVVFSIGAYTAGPSAEIDATCNFWGTGATAATISQRIDSGPTSATLIYDPFDCP